MLTETRQSEKPQDTAAIEDDLKEVMGNAALSPANELMLNSDRIKARNKRDMFDLDLKIANLSSFVSTLYSDYHEHYKNMVDYIVTSDTGSAEFQARLAALEFITARFEMALNKHGVKLFGINERMKRRSLQISELRDQVATLSEALRATRAPVRKSSVLQKIKGFLLCW